MAETPAYFVAAEHGYVPLPPAHSRWGPDHLAGPCIVGLAARAMEQQFGSPEMAPTRLTVDLFKTARSRPTTVDVRMIRDGRRVRLVECEVLQDGVAVAQATLVSYRRSVPSPGQQWASDVQLTPPTDVDREFGAATYTGSDEAGWTEFVGDHQNASRTRFLPGLVDVVAGEVTSPFVRAAITAEFTSLVSHLGTHGIGYINGDLTVGLSRLPGPGWLAVQAESHWAADGVSVGSATLFDADGAFGTAMVTAVANPAAQIDFSAG